ncbi:hypothetical protein HYD_1880 [Candidatus Hydrogenosomobacter endosymbioticus]|uniref:Uncharacterized protein n=1 Tax=Candidatus Hydrogenosomobacter endosymbioticus TaxID=2558174 RepID=A0ABM7V8E4_9PROT|nr:hypothetical protein HYD_1880 [Candidatus Hydrogenosomobacter endosymbioticus]
MDCDISAVVSKYFENTTKNFLLDSFIKTTTIAEKISVQAIAKYTSVNFIKSPSPILYIISCILLKAVEYMKKTSTEYDVTMCSLLEKVRIASANAAEQENMLTAARNSPT